jgi:hypothetical protein
MSVWKRRGLWVTVGVALLSAVVLADLGTLLTSIEGEGQRAYGPAVFTGLKLDPRNTEDLSDAIALWQESLEPLQIDASAFDVRRVLRWHLAVDAFLFVPAYATLLGLLLCAASATWRFARNSALAVAVLDLLETSTTALVLLRAGLDLPFPRVLELIQWLALGKWAAIAVALLTAAALWWRSKASLHHQKPAAANRTDARHLVHLSRLFILVGMFAAVVAVPTGGTIDQFPDVIRRQLQPLGAVAVRSLVALAVFCAALVAGGLLSTQPARDRKEPVRSVWVLVGACCLAAMMGFLGSSSDGFFRSVIAAPVLVVILIASAAWLARKASVSKSPLADHSEPPATTYKRALWVGSLPAMVIVAIGLGLVRAAFPFIVLNQAEGGGWIFFTGLGALGAVAGGCVTQECVSGLYRYTKASLQRKNGVDWSSHGQLAFITLTVVIAGVQAVALARRPDDAHEWGTLGVVMLSFSIMAVGVGILAWAARAFAGWSATRELGFGPHTPWLMLLLLTWGVASILNTEGIYHDVRRRPMEDPRYANLDAALGAWISAQKGCEPEKGGSIPLVLVAAPGGGIRAAYWTAAALDKVFAASGASRNCAARRLFLISGVSGGSVGATIWAAAQGRGSTGASQVREIAEDRALAAVTAGLLLRDINQPFTGIARRWRSRASLLEDGWAASTSALRVADSSSPPDVPGSSAVEDPTRVQSSQLLSFNDVGGPRDASWTPVLVLNASSVADGCRVLIANVGEGLVADERGACLAGPLTQNPAGTVTAAVTPLSDLHFRPGKHEGPCGGGRAGVAAATAALISARFPWVTPSGALYRCRAGDGKGTAPDVEVERITYAVDGGYQDNSGLLTLIQLRRAIEALLAKREQANANGEQPAPLPFRVVPWLLVVDNHYRSVAEGADKRRPMELFVPLGALMSNRIVDAAALEQMAAVEMKGRAAECDGKGAAEQATQKTGATPDPKQRVPTVDCVVLVAPRRRPSIAAPLGWVLSEATLNDLDRQLDAQLSDEGIKSNPLLGKLREQLR